MSRSRVSIHWCADEFLRGLLELTEQEGWSVFISSHDIDEVERLCDGIAVIDRGGLRLNETVVDLHRRFRRISFNAAQMLERPTSLPDEWHHLELAGHSARLTTSRFRDEAALRDELSRCFGGEVTIDQLEIESLSLREIFISLARQFRLDRPDDAEDIGIVKRLLGDWLGGAA